MNNDEIFGQIRKSCIWMGAFAASFVAMYVGIVAFISFQFKYFGGYAPDIDHLVLRAAAYGAAVVAVALLFYTKRKRNLESASRRAAQNFYEDIKFFINTVILSMALSEVPLICGFFMFFLGGLYWDFFALAAISILLVILNMPTRGLISKTLTRA